MQYSWTEHMHLLYIVLKTATHVRLPRIFRAKYWQKWMVVVRGECTNCVVPRPRVHAANYPALSQPVGGRRREGARLHLAILLVCSVQGVGVYLDQNAPLRSVLRIHDILVWIRIRGSMPLTYGSGSGCGSGSCSFRHWLSRCKQKLFFFKSFFAYYFLKVHSHHFSKIKSQLEVTKQ